MGRPEVLRPVICVIQVPRVLGGDRASTSRAEHLAELDDRGPGKSQALMFPVVAAGVRVGRGMSDAMSALRLP